MDIDEHGTCKTVGATSLFCVPVERQFVKSRGQTADYCLLFEINDMLQGGALFDTCIINSTIQWHEFTHIRFTIVCECVRCLGGIIENFVE